VQLDATFLRSRVGRRIFLLFVCSALLPVATLAVLSFEGVSSQLYESAHRQLHRESKAIGMALFERLTFLDGEVRLTAARIRHDGAAALPADVLRTRFDALALLRPGREATPLIGALARFPELSGSERSHLEAGKPVLSTAPAAKGRGRVFLSRAVDPGNPRRGILVGEVNAGELLDFPSDPGGESCILDQSSRPLACPPTFAKGYLQHVQRRLTVSSSGRIGPDAGAESSLGHYWELFLEPTFHTRRWTVVVRQSQAQALTAMQGFESVFPPVILLSVLVVLLMTIVQIRRQLVPLEQLREGTSRVARRDFRTPVPVRGNDEFGELAQAFNAMAGDLDRQFNTLATMSELDRIILSALDTDYITEVLLTRLPDVTRCDCASVSILSSADGRRGITHCYAAGDGGIRSAALKLSPPELRRLRDSEAPLWWREDEPVPSHLEPLRALGAETSVALPVRVMDGLVAVLGMGVTSGAGPDSGDLERACGLADRAAVALSSAAWEERLYEQTHYDALTGLPNRALLKDRLDQAVARARRNDNRIALLFLDLDRFKAINDSMGHVVGDSFLKEVAQRLARSLRDSDTIVRFGGDEFVIVLPDMSADTDARVMVSNLCREMLNAIAQPFVIEGHELQFTGSIGVALYPDDAQSDVDLMKSADAAMHHAKTEGKGRFLLGQSGSRNGFRVTR